MEQDIASRDQYQVEIVYIRHDLCIENAGHEAYEGQEGYTVKYHIKIVDRDRKEHG